MTPSQNNTRKRRMPTGGEVLAWAEAKRKTIAMVLAGVIGCCSGVWLIAHPLIEHEAHQDAAAVANATDIRGVSTQMNTWHDERVRENNQTVTGLEEVRKQLSAQTIAIHDAASEIRSAKEQMESLQRSFNVVIPLLRGQATAAPARSPLPRSFVTIPEVGPPADVRATQ